MCSYPARVELVLYDLFLVEVLGSQAQLTVRGGSIAPYPHGACQNAALLPGYQHHSVLRCWLLTSEGWRGGGCS